MANKAPNLKIHIGADTSEFQKGARQARQDLKSFESSTKGSLSSIGQAFGVNTAKIEQMTGAIRGMGQKMTTAGNAGVKAFGQLLTKINPVIGAITGIALGGVIAGFKALTDQAEAFKKTVQGANLELGKSAYLKTYSQFLNDMNRSVAEGAAVTRTEWQKAWGSLKAIVGTGLSNIFSPQGLSGGFGMAIGMSSAASIVGAEAEKRAREIYEIQRKQSDNLVTIANLDNQISEQRLIAQDASKTTEERLVAISNVQELIRKKYALQLPLAQRLADLLEETNKLASSTPEEIDAANRQRVVAINLEQQQNDELRSITRLQNSITKTANAEAEAQAKAAKAAQEKAEAYAKARAEMASWAEQAKLVPAITGQAVPLASPQLATNPSESGPDAYLSANIPVIGKTVYITFNYDKKKLEDVTNAIQNAVAGMAETTASILGELAGNLLTGGGAWESFKNSAVSAFGDMAISVGKLAVATGVASLGIKAALESLNGYAAIAAGVALIALGTAVKTGLRNIASGGASYSAASNVASSTAATQVSNNDFNTKEVTVKVAGTLRADGNELIAVINNADGRNKYTT